MSVKQYYPFNGSKNRLRVGLHSIAESEWIQYEDDFSSRIEEKQRLILQQKPRVIQSITGSEAAQNELLENILLYIDTYQKDLFTVNENAVLSHVDNRIYKLADYQSRPLELISYLAIDDFCLLDKLNDDYRLNAASVCAPTYWELAEKIGKPMKEVHASIPRLEDKIGRMIRHFFINLQPDHYYQRANWFLMTTPKMPLFKDDHNNDTDVGALNVGNIMQKLYLRCERQSFRKLAQTKNIVFGIKIYVAPLSIIEKHKEIAKDMILSVQAMSVEQKQLLGITPYEVVLKEYLHSVAQV